MLRNFIIFFLLGYILTTAWERKHAPELPTRCPDYVGSKTLVSSVYDLNTNVVTCNYMASHVAYGKSVWKQVEPMYYLTDKE